MTFYKNEDGWLAFGPNYVLNMNYELYADQHETYTYPVDGWYWFDTEEEARIFFDLPASEPLNEPPYFIPPLI